MEAVFSPTFIDAARSIIDLQAEVYERVRRKDHEAQFQDEEDECPRCGKPVALGACVESDCPLEGSE